MNHYLLLLEILLLLLVANGAPILARKLLQNRFPFPLDRRATAWDGRPWLGDSKTWRGLLAAFVCTPCAAWLLGFEVTTGMLIALGAMSGDLFSSFAKRRMNIPSSGQALGLDQIPEALLPLLLIGPDLALTKWDLVLIILCFFVLELWLSRVLYLLRIRKRPY